MHNSWLVEKGVFLQNSIGVDMDLTAGWNGM